MGVAWGQQCCCAECARGSQSCFPYVSMEVTRVLHRGCCSGAIAQGLLHRGCCTGSAQWGCTRVPQDLLLASQVQG